MARKMWEPEPELAQRITELYEEGWSGMTIYKRLGLNVSPETVLRWLHRNDIQVRNRGINEITVNCEVCGTKFSIRALNYALCFDCAPTSKWADLYRKYGITKPQFDAMYEKQSGLCDLCELPLPKDEKICIDHCHTQGHVRALLHNKCNIGLHYIEDDKFLANAVRYVERHRK